MKTNSTPAIYEIRAHIGTICYTQIFATLEAAMQRATDLHANYGYEGTINRLSLNGETYEVVERVCYL